MRAVAPKHLTKVASDLWKEIVSNHSEDHFAAGNLPLLEAYCSTYATYREIQGRLHKKEKAGELYDVPYGRLIKSQSGVLKNLGNLASKMRLSQHSAYSHKKAQSVTHGKLPHEQ